MVKKVCKASTVVEMAYLMPVVLMVWMLVIFMLFYYHDKSILTGAAYEASVVGAELWREDQEYRSVKVENYFKERISGKLLFFEGVDVRVLIDDTKVVLNAEASKYRMTVDVEIQAAVTEPENIIRKTMVLDETIEDVTK